MHENAFTDINETITQNSVYYHYALTASIEDKWLEKSDVTSIAYTTYDFEAEGALFEDGWWEGITVDDPDYETIMAFMANVEVNYW